MQYDEEAHAIGSRGMLVNSSSTITTNNSGGRTSKTKSVRNLLASFLLAAAIFLIATASFFSQKASQESHDEDDSPEALVLQLLEMDEKLIFQGNSVSFHPENTSSNIASISNSDDSDLFDGDVVDPLESLINSFSSEDELDSEAIMVSDSSDYNRTRLLQEYPTPDYLYPLPCNEGVEALACTTPLSSLPVPTDGSPLVIECGTCVYVDTSDGSQLDLPNGLRIEGKLYFPPESSITIRTIFVMVLGILKMDNPFVGNEVKFSLYGEDDIFFTADPAKQNPITSACVNGCKIGKKAIAVVGGQLDIQGIDETCPSWEILQDISTAGTLAPSASPTISSAPTMSPNNVCAGNLFVNGDFTDDSFLPSKAWGAVPEKHDDALNPGNNVARFSNRAHSAFGIYQRLNKDCFNADFKKLKIEMDLRLLDGVTDEGVECQPGTNCPYPLFKAKMLDDVSQWIGFRDEDMEWNKDGWSHFSTIIDVPEQWENNLKYVQVIIGGGPEATTLLIDNVSVEKFVGSVAQLPSSAVDPDPNNQIHLSQQAAGCWTPGSEILITSNTLRSKDYQLASIESTDPMAGTVKLTSSIDPVSTLAADPNHAVEVALLSRRIVFEADDDADDHLIGGHLIVMLTPNVEQHLEGVEIRNFGQQGNLGRYPVHFHLCDDGFGSVVKKNVVRQSNQRCYVMHGTNGVLIQDNVAFDTFGHCFMTEDGVEHSNRFIRNLGAHTKDANRLVSEASKRKESDDNASTFWMTNMDNHFEGNVAAGTESHGYWAETHQSMVGRGGSIYQNPTHKPMYTNLGSFKDNTAHSFDTTGFTSYPPGWLPKERAVIENFRAYRGGTGAFLHNARMLSFVGGYMAQVEHVGFRVFGADDIIVDGMELVGNIEGEEKLCKYGQHLAFILSPHRAPTKGKDGEHFGTKLKNLTLKNWSPRDDCYSPLVEISTTQIRSPAWDAYQLMENINYDDSNPQIANACSYESLYANDAAIEIKGDTNTLYGGSGYLVGSLNIPLSGSTCTDVGGCLHFCPGACLRTIKFHTSGARDVFDYVMKVSDGESTITVKRWFSNFNPESGPFLPTLEERYFEYSFYSVSLPAGSFDVWFEDKNNPGVVVYPKFVNPFFEAEPSCANFATKESINIIKPPVEDARCNELIHNGDFAADTAGWQEWEADFFFGETAGIHGTGALVTKRTNHATQVTQWLDLSCLVAGDYLFHASYRLVDQVNDLDAAEDIIDPDKKPIAVIMFNRWDEERQKMKSIPHSSLQNVVPPTPAPTASPTQAPTEAGVPVIGSIQTLSLPHLDDVFPLAMCQGRCISDDDCQGDLGCMDRDGNESVPGCAGEGSYGTNYCYDPFTSEATGFNVMSGSFTITPEQAAGVAARLKFFYFESNFILDHVSLVKAPWSTSQGENIFV